MAEIKLTADQVTVLVASLSSDIVSGLVYADDTLVVPDEHAARIMALLADEVTLAAGHLSAVKSQCKLKIDSEAEAERLKYITSGAGQAMAYQRKSAEAKACLSATDPQAFDYPMLAAEIGITAATLIAVAEAVNAADAAWLAIGAAIEAVRLGAKAAIDAAETAEAARAAANVVWPAG